MENEDKASPTISLRILVEKQKNQVVFAESNKDFVDVIFSLLTIPCGTIVGLFRQHLLKGDIGCFNCLYSSIENLDEEYLSIDHKAILLHPRTATEIYCKNLKLNLLESEYDNKYYACHSNDCAFLSYFQNPSCPCGKSIELELNLSQPVPQDGGVFVKPTARFMITDDFRVLPLSTMTGLFLLSDCGVVDGSQIEERTLNIGKDEVVKLLKCSLASRTPLSDALLGPNNKMTIRLPQHVKYGPGDSLQSQGVPIKFKLIISKSKNKALYAEVDEDFVDVLCSFLAIPIGYVFKELPSLSFKGCTDNLYKSILDPHMDKFFKSEKMKETILSPKLAPGLAFANKLIGIEEAEEPSYHTVKSMFSIINLRDLSSESPPIAETKAGGGFLKGPSMFMVSDNLHIAPLSPIRGISIINGLKVPANDIKELQMTMGREEALHLLAASLGSKCALTDAFVLKEPKQEF